MIALICKSSVKKVPVKIMILLNTYILDSWMKMTILSPWKVYWIEQFAQIIWLRGTYNTLAVFVLRSNSSVHQINSFGFERTLETKPFAKCHFASCVKRPFTIHYWIIKTQVSLFLSRRCDSFNVQEIRHQTRNCALGNRGEGICVYFFLLSDNLFFTNWFCDWQMEA